MSRKLNDLAEYGKRPTSKIGWRNLKMLRTLKHRASKLETATQPKTGLLPVVVGNEVTAAELLRLRIENPGRTVARFSESTDLFL